MPLVFRERGSLKIHGVRWGRRRGGDGCGGVSDPTSGLRVTSTVVNIGALGDGGEGGQNEDDF